MATDSRIAIVGGCGHVGLPLGLSFAKAGFEVLLYDINEAAVRTVASGRIPFMEEGGEELLRAHLGRNLTVTTDAAAVREASVVVCVVGTPIDEYLNPRLNRLMAVVEELGSRLTAGQLFVLRSTIFPGATAKVDQYLRQKVPGIDVAFCPERVAQGYSIREIGALPQIVSGTSDRATRRASELFAKICPKIVELEPVEAELGKLFCNSWRYITFAVANQFYQACAENGIDYYRVWSAIVEDYPRMRGLPKAGFAAGPCLFKDTMQLAAWCNDDFALGQAAMRINEGMPRTLVRQLKEATDLDDKVVGILGMAFKGDNDDVRESLSFKLRKLLKLECKDVLCTDAFVRSPDLVPLDRVLEEADLLVVGAPHTAYRDLAPRQPILDPWNLLGRGGLLVGE